MAVTRVQTGTAATTTGTGTVTPTLPAGATAGNVIVALVSCNAPATAPSFSSSGGATKQVESNVGSATCVAIFTKVAAGGETNIGAFPLSTGTRDCYGVLIEYSGLSGITAATTGTGGSSTASTTPNTGLSGASATAPGLALGIESHINALQSGTAARMGTDTSTGGTIAKLAEAASGSATAAQRVCARATEIIISGSGSVGHQVTITTARAWAGAIIYITEASASTPIPPEVAMARQRI